MEQYSDKKNLRASENAQAHMNLGVALEVKGEMAEGARELQQARLLDADIGQNESDYGIGYLNREQFRVAVENANCRGIVEYGTKLLAAVPDDEEVSKAVKGCQKQATGNSTQSNRTVQ